MLVDSLKCPANQDGFFKQKSGIVNRHFTNSTAILNCQTSIGFMGYGWIWGVHLEALASPQKVEPIVPENWNQNETGQKRGHAVFKFAHVKLCHGM